MKGLDAVAQACAAEALISRGSQVAMSPPFADYPTNPPPSTIETLQ
jgi:hypothetical protein